MKFYIKSVYSNHMENDILSSEKQDIKLYILHDLNYVDISLKKKDWDLKIILYIQHLTTSHHL